ncbi:MAG: FAD/FMN-containing dehydrogenase [Cellvibrionaceae bacterium]|jgi:FAD/FMN-containing dehydrogenase
MKRIKKMLLKKVTIVFVVLAMIMAFLTRRYTVLSADPSGEKDCPPLVIDADGQVASASAHAETTQQTASAPLTGINLPWYQRGGTVNDASCLNRTAVHGVVKVQSEDDILQAVSYAKDNGLRVSIAGVRHSMGGHAFAAGAVVLDMLEFNNITLNEEAMTVTVQSGTTWHQIQDKIHPQYAVTAMQSTDIFSVGGSISVNAHGMDHNYGALGNTVRSLKIMLADGSIQTVSRTENPELYFHALGGYGLFGIILEAELDITENAIYETSRQTIPFSEFQTVFENEIESNTNIALFYAHLSTAPQNLFDEVILYKYEETGIDINSVEVPPLAEGSATKAKRWLLNVSKRGPAWRYMKWWAEKKIEPMIETCTISRNQAMTEGESCMVSRNNPMHDSVPYLQNDLKNDTDILHEYFIPRDEFDSFVAGTREIILEHDANLLNASVRVVHHEDNVLTYAPEEMFSLVLYVNQSTDETGNQQMAALTAALIDLTIEHNGRFFLPYQLYYTADQLEAAYPEIEAFFATKRKYDPEELFRNTFYNRYAPAFE